MLLETGSEEAPARHIRNGEKNPSEAVDGNRFCPESTIQLMGQTGPWLGVKGGWEAISDVRQWVRSIPPNISPTIFDNTM